MNKAPIIVEIGRHCLKIFDDHPLYEAIRRGWASWKKEVAQLTGCDWMMSTEIGEDMQREFLLVESQGVQSGGVDLLRLVWHRLQRRGNAAVQANRGKSETETKKQVR